MFNANESVAGYRIVSKLGAGGMGEVWCAEDTKLGRETDWPVQLEARR